MYNARKVNEVFIYTKGNPSVGIQSSTLEISGLDMIADDNMIKFIREELQNLFSKILDDYVSIEFDFEIKDKIEREKNLERKS